MLYQRCTNVVSNLCNVVSTSATDVVSTLCNVENSTQDFVSFSTSDQSYFNVDPQCWNNVDPTLKCWLGQLWTLFTMISYFFFRVFQLFGSFEISKLWIHFLMPALRWLFRQWWDYIINHISCVGLTFKVFGYVIFSNK